MGFEEFGFEPVTNLFYISELFLAAEIMARNDELRTITKFQQPDQCHPSSKKYSDCKSSTDICWIHDLSTTAIDTTHSKLFEKIKEQFLTTFRSENRLRNMRITRNIQKSVKSCRFTSKSHVNLQISTDYGHGHYHDRFCSRKNNKRILSVPFLRGK